MLWDSFTVRLALLSAMILGCSSLSITTGKGTISEESEEWDKLASYRGTHLTLPPMEHEIYCGNRDLASAPKCIRYKYESSAFIQSFIINKDIYKEKIAKGEELSSRGMVVSGSFCLGSACEILTGLDGIDDWCLLFLNIDDRLVAAEVDFEYQVCTEKDHKDDMILILLIICIALLVVTFSSCLAFCWVYKRRKAETEKEISKEELMPLNTTNGNEGFIPFLPPPPPMVRNNPYMHEPIFQVQSPLPLSHVPPPPQEVRSSCSRDDSFVIHSENELRRASAKKSSRVKHKSTSKIRFPI